MGFVRDKVYKLIWPEGEELEGLEVRAGTVPLGTYLEITAILDGQPPERFTDDKDGRRTFDFVLETFAGALISWNLEDADGTPVAPTLENIWAQDREFTLIVVRAWVTALSSVSRPLKKPSPAGEQSVAASIPMETLSESQAS